MTSLVRLHSMWARGFRTIREANVDLSQQLTFVRSHNTSSGTTSGCGKTALLSIPSYVLGFGPTTTSVCSWHLGEVEAGIVASFDDDVVKIARGSKGLRVSREGLVDLTGRQAESWLKDKIGPTAVAKACSLREQRSCGNFFTFRPAEKCKFLGTILGLELYEKASKVAAEAASKLEREASQVAAQVTAKQAVLEAKQGERSSLAAALALHSETAAEERFASSSSSLSESEAVLAAAQELLTEVLAQNDATIQQQKEIESLRRKAEREEWEARKRHESASRKLAAASGNCPTCGSVTVVGETLIRELSVQVDNTKNELDEAVEFLRLAREVPMPELRSVNEALEIETLAKQQRAVSLAEVRKNELELERLRAKRFSMESRLKDLETSIASTIEAISKQQTEQLRLEALALAENELALLVGKRWQRAVLDEVLAEITAETNRILAYIPNTADFTISFETVERGEERDVIQRIWVGGVERSDPECMSGGQKSSIELASDLAVSTVLTARGLSRLQWMVLDEPFDGMGDVDRAAFVDLLRERLTLFLVSAHNPEFTEDFRLSGIGLEFDGEFARIVSDQERAKSSW